jgi:uncharacterized delta-60 repeat protein
MLPNGWARVLAGAVLSFVILTGQAYANGDLDQTFGTGGKVTTDLSGREDEARGVAIQPDGKIVVVGLSEGSDLDFAVARYNPDGTLDVTFGNEGAVITDFGGNRDVASAVVIQPDGKILVVGTASIGLNLDFALARYNPDGSIDTTFGIDGKATTDFGGRGARASVLSIQADGSIVVAGTTGTASFRDFALARYTHDGTLDIRSVLRVKSLPISLARVIAHLLWSSNRMERSLLQALPVHFLGATSRWSGTRPTVPLT